MQMRILAEEIQNRVNKVDGRVGVVIKDLKSKRRIAVNSRQSFDAASIIKLFVIVDLMYQHQEGLVDLNEQIPLDQEDIVGGCGVLQLMQPGTLLTLHDLAALMICISDNTATNMLIERLGIHKINDTIQRLGLRRSRLARKLCILIPGLHNYTTPQDTAILLQSLSVGDFLNQERRDYILNLLSKQQLNNKLPDRLLFCPICKERVEYAVICPNCQTDLKRFDAIGIHFAHKTGEVVGSEHDAGILFLPDRQVVVSCFTGDLQNNEEGIRFHQDLGIMLYEFYNSSGRWR